MRTPRLFAALALCAALLPRMAAAQSIATDGTVGPKLTLTGPSYAIGASLGKVVGANLFQSFLKFGLISGESASFSGAEGIADIIARVTGGSPSNISGAITSSVSLFLINPFGIVFGPGAVVNVAGSFHASTAAYLKMSDGSIFSATNPQSSTFSAAPPAAFGFLNGSPPAITVQGSTIAVQGTLGLVGGPVTITGSTLSAPGGAIHIASAAGAGEIPVDPLRGPPATVTAYGPVRITGGALLTVASGGSVFIRAGSITIDASDIDADNTGAAPGGEILLQADGGITVSDDAMVHASSLGAGKAEDIVVDAGTLTVLDSQIFSDALAGGNAGNVSVAVAGMLKIDGAAGQFAAGILSEAASGSTGRAGRIDVRADNLSISANGQISSGTFDTRRAGDVSVDVAGLLTIDGASEQFATGIFSQANSGSTGGAGRIDVQAGNLSILANGNISSGTFGKGNGGSVFVTVGGLLTIDGSLGNPKFTTGIVSQTQSSGAAGNIDLAAAELLITGEGEIAAGTLRRGAAGDVYVDISGTASITDGGRITSSSSRSGQGGDVAVTVGGLLSIDGISYKSPLTGIFTEALQTNGIGDAGNIAVAAGQLSIVHRAEIASSTYGSGNAGDVTVSTGSLTMSNFGVISADTLGAGKAGDVLIEAGTASLSSRSAIASATDAKGAGGNLLIEISGDMTAGSGAVIQTIACGATCDRTSDTSNAGNIVISVGGTLSVAGAAIVADTFGSTGEGGNVTVTAGALNLTGFSGISSDTAFGAKGNGGDVSVTVTGQLTLDGGVITANTDDRGTTGNAGSVVVTAGSLTILNGASIATATFRHSRGNAGEITVDVAGELTIDGSLIASDSHQSNGNAGLITVRAGGLSVLDGGAVSTSTSGAGRGGDIQITASNIVLSGPGPQITAQSFGSGNAGSIEVSARSLQILGGASISTAGTTASGGNITLSIGDLLYLNAGEITTSSGGPGIASNGGNITIDPRFVVLTNGSRIKANANGGNGGNINISAGAFIASPDSTVTASSQKGISGTITISGQLVGLNGILVVLPGTLRNAEAILENSCAARRALPQSTFVDAGRGGLPQDPETVLPALYLAPHAAASGPGAAPPAIPAPPRRTAIRLEMRCG